MYNRFHLQTANVGLGCGGNVSKLGGRAVPSAQPLPQTPHLPLSRAQSHFWTLLLIGQSYLVHVWRFSRILPTLPDDLQDVSRSVPFTKIAHAWSIWSFSRARLIS